MTIPKSFDAAVASTNANYWWGAMDEEIRACEEKGTWELQTVDDKRAKILAGKWVYDVKFDNDGYTRFKARIVAKGSALYGLKQSGREWNTHLTKWFIDHNFKQSEWDPCLFTKITKGGTLLCAKRIPGRFFQRLQSDT